MNAVLLIALCIGLSRRRWRPSRWARVAARGRVHCTPAAATTAFSRASPLVASRTRMHHLAFNALEDDDGEVLAADVAAASMPPPPPPTLKEQLLAAVAVPTDSKAAARAATRSASRSSRCRLTNPTAEPARSSLINGKWELVFSGSPGGASSTSRPRASSRSRSTRRPIRPSSPSASPSCRGSPPRSAR